MPLAFSTKEEFMVDSGDRSLLWWWVGALVVVLGVGLWLWWMAQPQDTLPSTYHYGIL